MALLVDQDWHFAVRCVVENKTLQTKLILSSVQIKVISRLRSYCKQETLMQKKSIKI